MGAPRVARMREGVELSRVPWLPPGYRVQAYQEGGQTIYQLLWDSGDEAFLTPEGLYFGYNLWDPEKGLQLHDFFQNRELIPRPLDLWERWVRSWEGKDFPFRSRLLQAWWLFQGAPAFSREALKAFRLEFHPGVWIQMLVWDLGGLLVLALKNDEGEVFFRWS